MKEEKKKYMAFCRRIAYELQPKMFLNLYGIDFEYCWQEKDTDKHNDNCVTAEIKTNHRYYSAHLKLYPSTFEMFKKGKRERVAEVIVHELCHIITDPLYKIANEGSSNNTMPFIEDVREQTTQHLTNIMMCYLQDLKFNFNK